MSILWLLLTVSALPASDGAIRLAKTYGDHMVLQRAPNKAVIWGFADRKDDVITAEILGQNVKASSKVYNGRWKLKLEPMTNEGPFNIAIHSLYEGFITIHDVLFGDVWLCGGQSNMGFSLKQVHNSDNEVNKASNFDKIRIFGVRNAQSTTPLTDLKDSAHWTAPTKTSAPWFSAVCLMYGEYLSTHRKYPIGLIASDVGGTAIETWSSPQALAKCPKHAGKRAPPNTPSVLWNAMIHPLLGMTIYGAIWYQGESNAWEAQRYDCQQPAMVNDWRQQFHKESLSETHIDFPFGLVQLAASDHDFNKIGGFPALRWAQTGNVGYLPNAKLPHTFMAVAMDLPDFSSPYGSIHSRMKRDVAERLGLASLAVAYGQKGLNYQGPFPTSFNNHVTNQLTIEYDNGHIVLDVRSNNGFEVCCSTSKTDCGVNDQWVAAPINQHKGATVTLDTSGCHDKHLVGLRYAWRESPCEFKKCSIYGRDNDLPGPPFIRNKAF